jgi:hypothetical protein
MDGAEVAETTYTPDGWEHGPLRLAVRRVRFTRAQPRGAGCRRRRPLRPQPAPTLPRRRDAHCVGHGLILTDIPADDRPACEVERFAVTAPRSRSASRRPKLGQALRHPPSGDPTPTDSGSTPARRRSRSAPSGATSAPRPAPPAGRPSARRCAGRPRRCSACSSACRPGSGARGRRIILRPPQGFRHEAVFRSTYQAAYALRPH